jgi:predicted HTH transcriptional regulator
VSVNILQNRHASIEEVGGKQIIVIEVPRAERQDKPVYINDDIRQSFRRNNTGDYRCKMPAIKAMLRDAANETQDMIVLDKMDLSVFDYESIKKYRTRLQYTRPDHVWENLPDNEFLFKLGAIGRSEDGALHPSAAGLLMFGYEYEIVHEYPQYFLDYQEHFDESTRWSDRFISSSGEWSGNIYEFFYMAINKIGLNPSIKTPFKMEGIHRVDETPVHKALREALANCLVHTDYYGDAGVVIKNYPDKLTIENPGTLRVPMEVALGGGISSPRNGLLMKMFNLIDVGERAGSGIPSIFYIWNQQKWEKPVLIEHINDLERITLVLPFTKAPIKSTDNGVPIKSTDNGVPIKSVQQKALILEFLHEKGEIRGSDLLPILNVKEERIKKLLQSLVAEGKIAALGANRNRTYKIKE